MCLLREWPLKIGHGRGGEGNLAYINIDTPSVTFTPPPKKKENFALILAYINIDAPCVMFHTQKKENSHTLI